MTCMQTWSHLKSHPPTHLIYSLCLHYIRLPQLSFALQFSIFSNCTFYLKVHPHAYPHTFISFQLIRFSLCSNLFSLTSSLSHSLLFNRFYSHSTIDILICDCDCPSLDTDLNSYQLTPLSATLLSPRN